MRLSKNIILILFTSSLFISGCASVPYKYGIPPESKLSLKLKPGEAQIERGRPVTFVDGLRHYLFSLPAKLILWDWDMGSMKVSEKTEQELAKYLSANDLKNVKVRINQYAPGAEWIRLFKNKEMPAFYRYTLGMLSVTLYTILPERLTGSDNYNPYTNTINIYSDEIPVALHEGAHAKDFGGIENRHWKGFYSFIRILPLVSLYQEAAATSDAIGYLKEKRRTNIEKDSYEILYPAYMTYIGGEGLRFASLDPVTSLGISFAIALPGHILGRVKSFLVEE